MQTYDPQSVEFNDFVKVLDEFSPVFTDVWVEIVWKCGVLTVQLNKQNIIAGKLDLMANCDTPFCLLSFQEYFLFSSFFVIRSNCLLFLTILFINLHPHLSFGCTIEKLEEHPANRASHLVFEG